jgi:hypothetical protein
LTPTGIVSFREFNRTASECGCVIVRGGEPQPITKLEPSHRTLFSYKKGKRATLRKLVSILGDEAAQQVWDDLKAKQKRPAATPSYTHFSAGPDGDQQQRPRMSSPGASA